MNRLPITFLAAAALFTGGCSTSGTAGAGPDDEVSGGFLGGLIGAAAQAVQIKGGYDNETRELWGAVGVLNVPVLRGAVQIGPPSGPTDRQRIDDLERWADTVERERSQPIGNELLPPPK